MVQASPFGAPLGAELSLLGPNPAPELRQAVIVSNQRQQTAYNEQYRHQQNNGVIMHQTNALLALEGAPAPPMSPATPRQAPQALSFGSPPASTAPVGSGFSSPPAAAPMANRGFVFPAPVTTVDPVLNPVTTTTSNPDRASVTTSNPNPGVSVTAPTTNPGLSPVTTLDPVLNPAGTSTLNPGRASDTTSTLNPAGTSTSNPGRASVSTPTLNPGVSVGPAPAFPNSGAAAAPGGFAFSKSKLWKVQRWEVKARL